MGWKLCRGILVQIGLSAALLASCTLPMSTSVVDSPRTVAGGDIEFTMRAEEFSADLLSENATTEDGEVKPPFSPWPLISMGARFNVGDKMDMGLRIDGAFFVPLWLPTAANLDLRRQLTPNDSDVVASAWVRGGAGGISADIEIFNDHHTYEGGFVSGSVGAGIEYDAGDGLALRLNGELTRAKIWSDSESDDPRDTFSTTIPSITFAVALGEYTQVVPFITLTHISDSPFGGYTFFNGGFAITRSRAKMRERRKQRAAQTAPGMPGAPQPGAPHPTAPPPNSLPPSMTPPI